MGWNYRKLDMKMLYNNPQRRFWHSLLFRRITAFMAFVAVVQALWIMFGPIVAIVDAVAVFGVMSILFLISKKLKNKRKGTLRRFV